MEAGEHTQVGELCQEAEEAGVGALSGDGEVVVVEPQGASAVVEPQGASAVVELQGAPAVTGNAVKRKLCVDNGEVSPSVLLPQVGNKAVYNRFFKTVDGEQCVCVVCNPLFMKKWEQFDKKVEENKKKAKENQKKLNRRDLYQNMNIYKLIASKRNHAMNRHKELYELVSKEQEHAAKKPRQESSTNKLTRFLKSTSPNSVANKQKQFEDHLCLLITKDLRPVSISSSAVFRGMMLTQNPQINFPCRHTIRYKLLPAFRKEVEEMYVEPVLKRCLSVALSFDLWMSRKCEDVFALVAHFVDPATWEVRHLCLGMIKADQTDGRSLAGQVTECLEKHELRDKVVAYVKDQGSNLNTCTDSLCSSLTTHPMGLQKPLEGSCFAHLLSKSLSRVLAKTADGENQLDHDLPKIKWFERVAKLSKCITWTKKSGKGRRMWEQVQKDKNLNPHVLITPVKTRMGSSLAMLKQMLEKREALDELYHNRIDKKFRKRALHDTDWLVIESVVDVLDGVSIILKKQQTAGNGFWSLGDAVMSILRLYVDMGSEPQTFEKLAAFSEIEGMQEQIIKLRKEAHVRVRKTLMEALKPFSEFIESQAHIVLSVMLHPVHHRKLPGIVNTIAQSNGHDNETEQGTASRILVPYVETLRHFVKSVSGRLSVVSPQNDSIASLLGVHATDVECTDIEYSTFLQIAKEIASTATDLDMLKWWKEHQQQFPHLSKVAMHIMGIPGSQIECERVFSKAGIITRHRRNRTSIQLIDTVMSVNHNLRDSDMFSFFGKKPKNEDDSGSDMESDSDSDRDSDSDSDSE
jgi:hypothetical protein